MDAVAGTVLRAIVRLHPKDVTGENMFGDAGMLPTSLTMHFKKLV
jgi:hypothetical protein